MKALILSFILIFGLAASNHGKPINEIYSINETVLSDEAYVNDIPFNTYEIAVEAILGGDEVKLEDEPYADDIPFNTREIACKYLLRKMIETSGEVNINDIPFSTEKIYCEYMAALLTEQYRNENPVKDLPEIPGYVICTTGDYEPACFSVKIKSPKRLTIRNRNIESSDFTIIQPVRIAVPKAELNSDAFHKEINLMPGFSL
jgi:hypothetical protein